MMEASNGPSPGVSTPSSGWELLGEDVGFEWARRPIKRTPPRVRRPRVKRPWGKWAIAVFVSIAFSVVGYIGARFIILTPPPAGPPAVVMPGDPEPLPAPIIIVPSESRSWAESILNGPARLRLREAEIRSGERAVDNDHRKEREARDEW